MPEAHCQIIPFLGELVSYASSVEGILIPYILRSNPATPEKGGNCFVDVEDGKIEVEEVKTEGQEGFI